MSPSQNSDRLGSQESSRLSILRPRSATLATVDEAVVGRVDGRGDLCESGLTLVVDGLDLSVSPLESGVNLVLVRVDKEKKVVGHGSSERETAPTLALASWGGASLRSASVTGS